MKLRIAEEAARIATHYCPICGKKLDAASCVSREGKYAQPKSGDYTVCIDCGGWLAFKEDLSLRKLDWMDIRDMPNEAHLALSRVSRVVKEIPRK
jgi:hypothetical protein